MLPLRAILSRREAGVLLPPSHPTRPAPPPGLPPACNAPGAAALEPGAAPAPSAPPRPSAPFPGGPPLPPPLMVVAPRASGRASGGGYSRPERALAPAPSAVAAATPTSPSPPTASSDGLPTAESPDPLGSPLISPSSPTTSSPKGERDEQALKAVLDVVAVRGPPANLSGSHPHHS